MSHFISGVNLEGALVFHSTPSEIVKPKMKRFLKSKAIETLFDKDNESKIIDHVCYRYSQLQAQNVKAQKEMFISNKCSVLKRKFKSSFNVNASGRSVQCFFIDQHLPLDQKTNKLAMNLKQLTFKMPKRLQLQKKYNSNINIKVMSIQQAQIIYRQKQEYRKWLDQNNNCHNSPNLNKMAFLFQKLANKKRKVRTEASQGIQLPQVEVNFNTQRSKQNKRMQFLLKQNNNSKQYSRQIKKPLAAINKQRIRYSSNDIDHYIF